MTKISWDLEEFLYLNGLRHTVYLQRCVIPWVPYLGSDRNNSTNIWWIAIKLVADIHDPKRIVPDDFGPPLTFHLAPPEGKNVCIIIKMSKTSTGTEFLSSIHGQKRMTNKMAHIIPPKHQPCLHEHVSMLPFSIQHSLAELPTCL